MDHFNSWARWHWRSCTFLKVSLGLIYLDWFLMSCDTSRFSHICAFNQSCLSCCVVYYFCVFILLQAAWASVAVLQQILCVWQTRSDTSGSGTFTDLFHICCNFGRTAGFCRSSSDGLLCSFTWILCFLSFFFTHHGNVHDFELLSRVSSVSVRLQWITKIRKRNKWRQSRWMKKCLVGTQKKIQLSVNT